MKNRMKIHNSSIIVLIALVLLASSCSTLLYTSVDILKPARVTFDPNDTRLLIVNNSVPQPADYGHRVQYFNEKPRLESVNTDSLSLFAIESLAESLAEKEFFSTITIHDEKLNNSNYFFSITHLPFDTVNALCDRFDSDVIISLDRIKVTDKVDEYFLNEESLFYTTLEARYETRWSVYVPEKTTYQAITLHDTVFWDARSAQRKQGVKLLPNRYNALIDGALYAGRNSINKFIPFWTKADRYFFMGGNKKLTQGMDSVTVRNWSGAIEVWTQILDSRASVATKAKASHNIAVVYEIQGELTKAVEQMDKTLEFLGKSAMTNSNTTFTIVAYYDELQKRKYDIELLNKQLGD